MKIARLTKIQFNSLENRDPVYIESSVTFIDDGKGDLTLKGKIMVHMRKLEKESIYLGYDGEFYPKYKIEYSEAN